MPGPAQSTVLIVDDAPVNLAVLSELPQANYLAREIIAAGRGSHFDPDMVDAFLGGFEEFTAITRRHLDTP